MIIFSGCGTTSDDSNTTASTCNGDLSMLSGDKPVITLEGDTEIEISLGTTEVLADDRYCAYDSQDGEISQLVVRSNNINFDNAGEYQVTYTVEDSDGFTDTKYRTITIVDSNNNTPNNLYGDPYANNPSNSNQTYDDTSTDNPNTNGGFDLGQQIGGGSSSSNTGGSDIDNFKTWYYNVCGQTFNDSKYNETTKSYSDTISCSGMDLDSIDLSLLSIFSAINGLDLSNNRLTDIDFSQLGLSNSTNNTKILISLNIKNNNLNTVNYDLFRPLHYLKNINKLYIEGNNFNYTCDDLYELRVKVLNNKSLDIDREIGQDCSSLQNK
jgi:hypothetical protein